jgi:hypothetical protein
MLKNYKIDVIENQSQVSPNLQILFYFNNNLGIEELGVSIIIIILGCRYHSLTKLIRLIGG